MDSCMWLALGSAKGLHILVPRGNTPNGVYIEVLCRIFTIITYDMALPRRRG
jgi:hypothetical protein